MDETQYRSNISTIVNHFYEKTFNLKELMNTETAEVLAVSRENYMKEYLNRFYEEWNGNK